MLPYGLFVSADAPDGLVICGGNRARGTLDIPRKCDGSPCVSNLHLTSVIELCSDWNWSDIVGSELRRDCRAAVRRVRYVQFWSADAWVTTEQDDTSVIYEAANTLIVHRTANRAPKPV